MRCGMQHALSLSPSLKWHHSPFLHVGSGGVPGAMFSVSPVSHPSSPEPDGAEYATPILDQPRHTPVNSSRFHFAGENGMQHTHTHTHTQTPPPLFSLSSNRT